MALIVEDGSVVAGADSYTTLSNARIVAGKYGWTLPDDDDEAERALRNGAKYVDMSEPRFGGVRVSSEQSLAWPRSGAYNSFGFQIPVDSIPEQAICGQVAAAAEFGNGTDVRATNNGLSIASNEVVGSVKQDYFNNGKTGKSVSITRADDCLKPLMTSSGGNMYNFKVARC